MTNLNQDRLQEPIPGGRHRVNSIDLLRGLVMIIMALDHTRDFFHTTAWTDDPLNLSTTTPALYFTRWITHLCAPTFVFLSGASAWFQSLRKSKKELSLFLIKRGAWLILMEITLINFSFSFDPGFHLTAFQVIWAIGISMVCLGLLIRLPFPVLMALGALIVLGHNALDFYEKGRSASPGWWYDLLHRPNFIPLWKGHAILVLYPFLPWTGLMILGYGFGKLYLSFDPVKRNRLLLLLGTGLLVFFVILRFTEIYGDPLGWSKQDTWFYTFLSFLNVQKYPPSLLFMCATIGISLLLLALLSKFNNGFTRFVTVYGRVPFFYYILHFYLIHLLSAGLYLARGHSWAEGTRVSNGGFLPFFIDPAQGLSLPWVYAIWLFVVLSLYPLCRWFSRYKQQHKDWWLSYL